MSAIILQRARSAIGGAAASRHALNVAANLFQRRKTPHGLQMFPRLSYVGRHSSFHQDAT